MHDKSSASSVKQEVLEILRSGAKDSVIQENLTEIFAKMVKLDLSFEQLKDKDLDHLSTSLTENETIKSLNISQDNSITISGVSRIANLLLRNKTLHTIYFNCNNLKNKNVGRKLIARAMRSNSTIHTAHFNFGSIGKVGASCFECVLRGNSTLRVLEFGCRDQALNHPSEPEEWVKRIQDAVKFYNISITSLGAGFDQSDQFKAMLEQNEKIQPLMEELVEMHSKLPEPIYENITEAVKSRSISLYNTRLLSVLCKDIYQNNPAAKISCCPPEIFYEIFKIYNEPKLQELEAKYGEIPTVCRATIMNAIKDIKEEISR